MNKIYILIVLSLLLSGCATNTSDTKSAVTPTQGQKADEVYIMAGKVEASEEASVCAKATSKIARVTVEVGTRVKKGDPLVYFDAMDIEAQTKLADANIEVARAALSRTVGGSSEQQQSQARTTLETSRLALDEAQKAYNRAKALNESDSALVSAKANYDLAKQSYDRKNELFNSGATTRQDLDAAQAGLRVCEDQLNTVKINMSQQQDTALSKLNTAKEQYELAKKNLDLIENKINPENNSAALAQLKQAQASREAVSVLQQNSVLYSPIDGIVTVCNAKQGEIAGSAATLVTVVNSTGMSVKAYLPSSMQSQIKEGQKTVVKIAELENSKFEGIITQINSVIDAKTKTEQVKISLSNVAGVKPGMYAQVALK